MWRVERQKNGLGVRRWAVVRYSADGPPVTVGRYRWRRSARARLAHEVRLESRNTWNPYP